MEDNQMKRVDEMHFFKKDTSGRRLVANLSADPNKDDLWNPQEEYHEVEKIKRFKMGIDDGIDLLDLFEECGNKIPKDRELFIYKINKFRGQTIPAVEKQLKKEGYFLEFCKNGKLGGRYFLVKNAEESIKRIHRIDHRQKKLKGERKFIRLIGPELLANTNKKTRLGKKAIRELEEFISKRG